MVVVLSTWESSRRGGGRVAVRLERTSYWWTYQRRCVNAGPKGSTQERAPPLGNQPENWWAE